jgi:hypothetical protein
MRLEHILAKLKSLYHVEAETSAIINSYLTLLGHLKRVQIQIKSNRYVISFE